MTYYATVERTAQVTELLEHDILDKAKNFIASFPPVMRMGTGACRAFRSTKLFASPGRLKTACCFLFRLP